MVGQIIIREFCHSPTNADGIISSKIIQHLGLKRLRVCTHNQLLFTSFSGVGGNCQELMDWYVDYDSSLKWCNDADDKVQKRARPGEYIMIVERQHGEIEVDII